MSHSLSEKRRDGGGWLPYHQDRRAVLAPCVGAIGLAQELGEERHGGARCVDREIWRRSLVRSRARSRDMVATTTRTSAATRAHLLRDTDHHDHRAERERERRYSHSHYDDDKVARWSARRLRLAVVRRRAQQEQDNEQQKPRSSRAAEQQQKKRTPCHRLSPVSLSLSARWRT